MLVNDMREKMQAMVLYGIDRFALRLWDGSTIKVTSTYIRNSTIASRSISRVYMNRSVVRHQLTHNRYISFCKRTGVLA